MEVIFLVFVFIAVIAVGALVFCLWATGTVLLAIGRGVRRLVWPKRRKQPRVAQTCDNRDCLCDNPAHARFCRRCGRSLPALLRLAGSQAA